MTCKCGAKTYEGHLKKVQNSQAGSHVYKRFIWSPSK